MSLVCTQEIPKLSPEIPKLSMNCPDVVQSCHKRFLSGHHMSWVMQLYYFKHWSIISRSRKFFLKIYSHRFRFETNTQVFIFSQEQFYGKLTNPNNIEQLHFEVINSILMIKHFIIHLPLNNHLIWYLWLNNHWIQHLSFNRQSLNSILMNKQSLNSILTIKQLLNSILIIKQSLDLILD